MKELYANAELYDVIYDEKRDEAISDYWKNVLEKINDITTIHDCSIGTGQMTLSLAKLGYQVSGSDISSDMLEKCKENAKQRNLDISLLESDFCSLSKNVHQKYDCVISTGNSLPHVTNDEVKKALHEMDTCVKDGGYLYVDIRNWDKILRDHQRFFFYQPFFVEGERINLTQVWDYNLDGTITFHLLYTFEKEGKIYKKEVSSTYYYPLSRSLVENTIIDMGYKIIKEKPQSQPNSTVDECDWYYILAKKE